MVYHSLYTNIDDFSVANFLWDKTNAWTVMFED